MLKRLAGSEFCSDIHRREYQQEFSQLALGRLLQSNPGERETPAAKAPIVKEAEESVKQAAAAVENRAAFSVVKPGVMAGRPEVSHAAVSSSVPAVASSVPVTPKNGSAYSFPPALPLPQPGPRKNVIADPAFGMPASIPKPAAAALQAAVSSTTEFEQVLPALHAANPKREPHMPVAELRPGRALSWPHQIEIADPARKAMEWKLHLREAAGVKPKLDLTLCLIGPEFLAMHDQPLVVPWEHIADAGEASLWISPACDFTGSVTSLAEFAKAQFSTASLEIPQLAEIPKVLATDPSPPGKQPQARAAHDTDAQPPTAGPAPKPADAPQQAEAATQRADSTPQPAHPPQPADPALQRDTGALPSHIVDPPLPSSAVATPEALKLRVPERILVPLPAKLRAISPHAAKPLQEPGTALISSETVPLQQAGTAPLLPFTLPGREETNLTGTSVVRNRPRVDLPPLEADTPQSSLSHPNPHRPELQLHGTVAPHGIRIKKIIAATGGAAVVVMGVLVFLGGQSDVGPKQHVVFAATGDHWITNFAPDAQRQRKISVLKSSMSLAAYRLEFESSIQIKALGWVYRAQDPKNYYVSKIELRKPGHTLAFVIAHYAVIDGVEEARAEQPLQVAVPLGGTYRIRFDAVGDRFTTWIQNQQVDEWMDSRLKTGGAGLYSEGVEKFTLLSEFQVTPRAKSR